MSKVKQMYKQVIIGVGYDRLVYITAFLVCFYFTRQITLSLVFMLGTIKFFNLDVNINNAKMTELRNTVLTQVDLEDEKDVLNTKYFLSTQHGILKILFIFIGMSLIIFFISAQSIFMSTFKQILCIFFSKLLLIIAVMSFIARSDMLRVKSFVNIVLNRSPIIICFLIYFLLPVKTLEEALTIFNYLIYGAMFYFIIAFITYGIPYKFAYFPIKKNRDAKKYRILKRFGLFNIITFSLPIKDMLEELNLLKNQTKEIIYYDLIGRIPLTSRNRALNISYLAYSMILLLLVNSFIILNIIL